MVAAAERATICSTSTSTSTSTVMITIIMISSSFSSTSRHGRRWAATINPPTTIINTRTSTPISTLIQDGAATKTSQAALLLLVAATSRKQISPTSSKAIRNRSTRHWSAPSGLARTNRSVRWRRVFWNWSATPPAPPPLLPPMQMAAPLPLSAPYPTPRPPDPKSAPPAKPKGGRYWPTTVRTDIHCRTGPPSGPTMFVFSPFWPICHPIGGLVSTAGVVMV
mmetsp:Transcript_10866/g.24316  ORF Transcript_10866/g.24316 Transcript_10866/m.24316 type:complete len:223 (+) Transcript_10866:84-752(+)